MSWRIGCSRHAPEAVDLAGESAATKRLYGLDDPRCREFGMMCLRGAGWWSEECGSSSFTAAPGVNGTPIATSKGTTRGCARSDQPTAALITDLKQRGLLDQTLVVWGGSSAARP